MESTRMSSRNARVAVVIAISILLAIGIPLRLLADENQSVSGSDACTLDCRETYKTCKSGCDSDDSDCQRRCNEALKSCLGTCN